MRILPCALLLAAAAGCASSPAPAPAADDPMAAPMPMPRSRRIANIITRDELADPSLAGATGLDAVRRLRPTFLSRRGTISVRDPNAGLVKVSIGGGTLGTLDDLERTRIEEIRAIRYLSTSEAAQRFGLSAGGSPVILVELR